MNRATPARNKLILNRCGRGTAAPGGACGRGARGVYGRAGQVRSRAIQHARDCTGPGAGPLYNMRCPRVSLHLVLGRDYGQAPPLPFSSLLPFPTSLCPPPSCAPLHGHRRGSAVAVRETVRRACERAESATWQTPHVIGPTAHPKLRSRVPPPNLFRLALPIRTSAHSFHAASHFRPKRRSLGPPIPPFSRFSLLSPLSSARRQMGVRPAACRGTRRRSVPC